jgi:hypothetical protein
LYAKKVNQKLAEAVSFCLVTDIWSSVAVVLFLGLAAMIINDKFIKEIIVIGLTEIRLPQNAENVKKAIETIINGYNFNKIKIFAVVCDEGSNLLRLFQNNAYCLYLYQKSKDVVNEKITQSDQ